MLPSQFADAEQFVGNATGAGALRALGASIAAAMNAHLWDAASNDHYVTQVCVCVCVCVLRGGLRLCVCLGSRCAGASGALLR
jgi:hypothetical protein